MIEISGDVCASVSHTYASFFLCIHTEILDFIISSHISSITLC